MSELSARDSGRDLFREKLAGSQALLALFRDGMGLVRKPRPISTVRAARESKTARALGRADLCDRKHAADHASDAACLMAAAASRGEGRRDVALAGQSGKDQGEIVADLLGRRRTRWQLLPEPLVDLIHRSNRAGRSGAAARCDDPCAGRRAAAPSNSVERQIGMLKAAFERNADHRKGCSNDCDAASTSRRSPVPVEDGSPAVANHTPSRPAK